MKIVDTSVELLDFMGNDNAVADAARVSFHKDASNYTVEQNHRLITYLAKHNHWTPFAHCVLKFRIKAPVFVARQLVKHQVGLAWNEVSRRYVDDEPEFWLPTNGQFRLRAENAKQGSSNDTITVNAKPWIQAALEEYENLIEHQIAPELARIILPQNTMTEWVWTGSLMAFARVCKLRLDPHAQQETREVAQMINAAVPKEFEHSWKALLE